MDEDPIPRYRWRKTWPDRENDFVALDGLVKFGRIHIYHMGNWFWCLYSTELKLRNTATMQPLAGYADTARLAAFEVERCYELVITGKWPGMVPLDITLQRVFNVGHPAMYRGLAQRSSLRQKPNFT